MSLEILLVDDALDTAKMLKVLLSLSGHKVQIADSVQSGLKTLAENHFDILISDLSLPDGNGKDLIRQLRSQNNSILAIAATGYCTPEDIEQCRQAGFDAHIAKPFDFDALKNTITELTELKV